MNKPPFLPVIIGTGFGSGFWPWGPGTAGTLLALVIWLALGQWLSPALLPLVTAALVIVSTLAGTWATARLMPYWGDDPSRVVIDEMAGVWLPLTVVSPCLWPDWVLAFVLFRLFDIFKPLGIRRLDNRKGAFWVMTDDLLAGIYTLLIIGARQLLWPSLY